MREKTTQHPSQSAFTVTTLRYSICPAKLGYEPTNMPSTNDESTRRLGIHKRRMKTLFECEKKEQSSYLGNSAQQTLGIQCSDLDLSTGLALDNSTAYISPRPLAQIDTMPNSTKPWQVRNFGDKEYTNYTAALQLWGILAVWLDDNYDERKEGILQYTNWKLRGLV